MHIHRIGDVTVLSDQAENDYEKHPGVRSVADLTVEDIALVGTRRRRSRL